MAWSPIYIYIPFLMLPVLLMLIDDNAITINHVPLYVVSNLLLITLMWSHTHQNHNLFYKLSCCENSAKDSTRMIGWHRMTQTIKFNMDYCLAICWIPTWYILWKQVVITQQVYYLRTWTFAWLPGSRKHAPYSFEYSHRFLRYGLLKFHDFGGRGQHKAYCHCFTMILSCLVCIL